MQLNAEEQQAVDEFRRNPEAQEEMRSEMRADGAEYGRELSEMVQRELGLEKLLSNSCRCGAADLTAQSLLRQAARLRFIGHDEVGVDIYMAAAKAELSWLGV